MKPILLLLSLVLAAASIAAAANPPTPARRADRDLAAYFQRETDKLSSRCLENLKTLDDWTSHRPEYKRQLAEMLGLDPMPERTDLKPVVTGKLDQPDFTVEKLQFQSQPGLYVTGDLFLPKVSGKPAPAVLYVCGHGEVKKNGISYGNKVHYQHWGSWLAQNGYVCLVIDTIQLGEIEGLHHGTYRDGMWWWNSRGYTPEGVEVWNSMRAIDYLQSRPEVDKERIGITGRSGGGAYSWYTAAMDDRIKVVIPVAGITDLQNHVVDGTVEGHCDCMFFVNTYRWDYPQLAAMIAPRPLLISNSDKDTIFPLDGVERLHAKVRRVYQLYGAEKNLGLTITDGPHLDTQELQVPALHWLNRFLKNENPLLQNVAMPYFQPEELKVFSTLPKDERVTRIQDQFVRLAPAPTVPASKATWDEQRDSVLRQLREKSFRGWPEVAGPLDLKPVFDAENQGLRLRAFDFTSQEHVPLRLYIASRPGGKKSDRVILELLDETSWTKFLAGMRAGFAGEFPGEALPPADEPTLRGIREFVSSLNCTMAFVAPRGIGPTTWSGTPKQLTQVRRRFMLLGQTVDGMRVWDARRAVHALGAVPGNQGIPIWLAGKREMSVNALYASLFEPQVGRLFLSEPPKSHLQGPDYLNVLRVMDIPQAVALAAEHSRVLIYQADPAGWEYPQAVAKALGWDPKQIEIRKTTK